MAQETKEVVDLIDNTTVQEANIDIDAMFGQPGADSIMLPEDGSEPLPVEKKPNIFSKEKVNVNFLDDKKPSLTGETTDETPQTEEEAEEVKVEMDELDKLINEEEDGGNVGRPKLDKDGLYDLTSKMIESGTLIPFDDGKELEDYSVKDFRELLEANFQERENKVAASMPTEFFNSLPDELQIAAKYVADGGQDLKGLFKTLSQVSEIVDLSLDIETHHPEIARQYLHATQFGTAEEIEEQISEWDDIGKLDAKASQFKPKLDKMQESIIANKLAQQESKKHQQETAAKQYMDNVYDTLSVGQLGDIKLDKKTQGMLYSGLVQPNYPSISGKPTNLLGHLLEKYQFVEPRHDLIAEALWLLQDPQGYKNKIKEQGGNAATEKVVRQLKTEEARKNVSSSPQEEPTRRKTKKTLQRDPGGFFKR